MKFCTSHLSVLLLPGLIACSGEQLPVDAQLSISPVERSYDIAETLDANGRCVINPELHIDIPFIVHLTTVEGSPIGDVELRAHLSLAENTFAGYPVLALYEDRNGNGVVDADTELVSGSDDGLATFRTDEISGGHALLVRANVSCAYRGELFIFGNGVTAEARIGVNAQSSVAEGGDL